MSGIVVSIQITEVDGGDLKFLEEAELVAAKGIVGDRYYREDGSRAFEALTLVEAEQVELINQEAGLDIDPAETRRNIVTRGVSLNDLVGKSFEVGEVLIKGVEQCQPCNYLGKHLASKRSAHEIVRLLTHRAGLRAQILRSGKVRVGDPILVEGVEG